MKYGMMMFYWEPIWNHLIVTGGGLINISWTPLENSLFLKQKLRKLMLLVKKSCNGKIQQNNTGITILKKKNLCIVVSFCYFFHLLGTVELKTCKCCHIVKFVLIPIQKIHINYIWLSVFIFIFDSGFPYFNRLLYNCCSSLIRYS